MAIVALWCLYSRQLRKRAESLQNTAIRGQRHLTDQTRASWDAGERADALWAKIQRDFRATHPELFPHYDDNA